MGHSQITIDRLRLFGALKRFKKSLNTEEAVIIDKIINDIKEDKKNHYLSISQEDINKVSYANSKLDKVNNNKRIKTTIGRYIRRKMNIKEDQLSDTTLSKLSEFVSIAVGEKREKKKEYINENIKILKGKDIVEFYKDTDYTLHTCMTGAKKSHLIDFYAINPDKVSLITASYKRGKNVEQLARAILWKTDNGDLVLDRIYPDNGNAYNMIKSWAKANNIKNPNKKHRITLNHDCVFPYLDKFKYGEIDENSYQTRRKSYVSSRTILNKSGSIILSIDPKFGNAQIKDQNGGFTPIIRCNKCGKILDKYRRIRVINSKNIKKYFCETCAKKTCIRCSSCNNFHLKNESLELKNDYLTKAYNKIYPYGIHFCYNCFNKGNKIICSICKKYNKKINCVVIRNYLIPNNLIICVDCLKNFE
jgi:hypothetical protein